jgi:dihydrofolate synthase/folylpolyglutamate synthase
MLTAMAFEHFATSKVDIAVLEVGMGGRLDATNVVEPLISVITDISLDHQKFLGNTVAEIAREKAGIIRPGGVVVTLPQMPEANDVIGNAVLEREARAVSAVPYVPPVSPNSPQYFEDRHSWLLGSADNTDVRRALLDRTAEGGCPHVAGSARSALLSRYALEVLGKEILVETPLVGRHQLRNVALAIAAAVELSNQGLPITPDSIERGIRETHWPGRFHVVPGSPEIVLDVAHNPAGAWALRSTLSACYEDRRLIFVFGAMRDKAIGEIAEILFPLAERVIATCAENPRSAAPEEVQTAAVRTHSEIELRPDVSSAMKRARELAGADGVIVVTGSIYIVGEAMRALGVSVA